MIGAVIGNYQIVRKLGEGGMGVVYLGQHTLLGRRAAIKVLLPVLSARPDIVSRFFNEARAVTTINDPGIVQVFDFGYHTDGSAYIVMEFLEGEPLDRRLARLGRLPVHEALRLCRQIASSLAAAHAQNIIHRDLKPENIFLVRDGEVASGERSKILDFGIAKLSDDHPGKIKTHTGMLMGTPIYMSPEQCRGLAEIDHRSDIYALGCVLFHLITGRPPFEGEGMGDIIAAHIRELAPAPSSRMAGIPPNVDALVGRCLAKAPADRFPSMGELAAAIGQLLSQVPVDAAWQYAHGAEHGAPGSGPPTYASRPPTPVPPTPVPPTPVPPSYVVPTTLGASAGQLPSGSARSSRIGRWIAGALVFGAVVVGIAIVGARNHDASSVAGTPHEPGSAGSAAAVEPPGIATTKVASSLDAGSAAPVVLPAPGPVTATATNPIDAAPSEMVVETAPPVVSTPVVTREPEKQRPRSHDHGPKTPTTQPVLSAPQSVASSPPPPHTKTTPLPHTTSTPPAGAPTAPRKCSKADFAAVYEAAVPVPGAVRAALGNLKACRDAGAISDAEFDRLQTALVARL